MPRSFGLVDYKVQEAEFFLLELRRGAKQMNFRAVQFYASAFAAAARSVTFAMQASLKGMAEFDKWYQDRQLILRADPLARFFHDFRTVTQHIGETVVSGGRFANGRATFYFLPCPDLHEVPELDVESACEAHFIKVLELVFDCYTHLGPIIDGQQYFTQENFARLGKTLEDAEEELGCPRGFTDIKKAGIEPYRWELLRRQADGCLIESEFWHWLKRELPRPEKLPPYIEHPSG